MTQDQQQPTGSTIPFLRGSEEQATKMRKRLEEMYRSIELVHDVSVLSIEVCESTGGTTKLSQLTRAAGGVS